MHGRSPEIWNIIRGAGLTAYDVADRAIHIQKGKPKNRDDAWQLVDRVMNDMQKAASKGKDRSFADFIEHSSHPEEAKRLAASYVEGFNAARKEVVGIASLAEDARASDAIDGDHSFRILNGYDSVPLHLARGMNSDSGRLRLNSAVERIDWKPGKATIHLRRGPVSHDSDAPTESVHTRSVVLTVPLGVLQAEAGAPASIRFHPELDDLRHAASQLRFGQVIRVVFRFREAFWEKNAELANAGFLLSPEKHFPTWWTTLPVRAPVLTGWSAGPHADGLLGQPQQSVISHALSDLARITGSTVGQLNSLLEAVHCHAWHDDLLARGAYSYVPAGALPARRTLAKPIANTLFFAGEATDLNGHSATVHGAIASGRRAARQIIDARRK